MAVGGTESAFQPQNLAASMTQNCKLEKVSHRQLASRKAHRLLDVVGDDEINSPQPPPSASLGEILAMAPIGPIGRGCCYRVWRVSRAHSQRANLSKKRSKSRQFSVSQLATSQHVQRPSSYTPTAPTSPPFH